MSARAIVTRVERPRFWVEFLGEEVPCLAPGMGNRVVVGDEVVIHRQPDTTYVITDRGPRRSCWTATAANLDQIVIVVAAGEPEFDGRLVERLVGAARQLPARPVVAVNKCDLRDEAEVRARVAPWVERGVPVVLTSAADGRGMPELRWTLAGRRSALVGQSGAGKTRLIEALYPGYGIKEVRGRLYTLPGGGYLAV